ncbi:hypothetical protein EVC62_02160 [Salinicola endophyticus]|uniref:Uncharacterized protein n=1 Tax=Salinicola endophyticus TaxID=1949083 RepID=A0ABY8FC55_9GAMM|nr:hypothetical protein EVC62_02160 [Salinicola endophyticus]
MSDHIHYVGDGRGRRKVYVDGRLVERAIYADVRRGIVDHFPTPLKIHKRGKRVISRRLHGQVTVESLVE